MRNQNRQINLTSAINRATRMRPSKIAEYVYEGDVWVNGLIVDNTNLLLKSGDTIEVCGVLTFIIDLHKNDFSFHPVKPLQ